MSSQVFSSIICIDSNDTFISMFISSDRNIYSVGNCTCCAHGHKKKDIYPPKQIKRLKNIKMIDCGAFHTLFLNFDGQVYSIGKNNAYQLGIDKDNQFQSFIPQKLNLPSISQISCGDMFSVCLSHTGYIYSFGNNEYGSLGLGYYNKITSSEQVTSPTQIPDINNVEYVICGAFHTICKTYNNEFYSWGYNDCGQLGQFNYGNKNYYDKPIQCFNWPDNIINIKCGLFHSLILSEEGDVYGFGDNQYYQLALNKNDTKIYNPTKIPNLSSITRIECGNDHSMCIDKNNNFWLFGANGYGQLGLGDKIKKEKPILHPTLSNIIDISSRGVHTFVKTIDNKIYAFGYNKHSQLGITTSEENQITPRQVFKDKEDIWCSFFGKSKAKSARK